MYENVCFEKGKDKVNALKMMNFSEKIQKNLFIEEII